MSESNTWIHVAKEKNVVLFIFSTTIRLHLVPWTAGVSQRATKEDRATK